MIGATWNVRGLNKRGKLQCITDFVEDNKLDFVGFQETKKDKFDDSFLNQVHKDFIWNYVPTTGTAGGFLVGLNSTKFEALAWRKTNSCIVVMIKNVIDKFIWRFVSVYGSPMRVKQTLFKNCTMSWKIGLVQLFLGQILIS
jgi:exonuclease III